MTHSEGDSRLAMLCADLRAVRRQTNMLCVHIATLHSRCHQDKADTLHIGLLTSAAAIQGFTTHLAVIEDELMAARLEANKLADAVAEFAKAEGISIGDIERLSLSGSRTAPAVSSSVS